MLEKKINLDEVDWIEMAPVIWSPTNGDERLAALVAYMTGDGTIANRPGKYVKKDGSVSVYVSRKTGAFYSNVHDDLVDIKNDCVALGMASRSDITIKKTKSHLDGFQLQISDKDCQVLVNSGAPTGRKARQEFVVPDWVFNGERSVKRAYLAALFGAEGTTPAKDKSSRSRFPRQPLLTMCKADGSFGDVYFAQLKEMLSDLGVEASVAVTGNGYRTYALRVASGTDNLIRFFEDVGYVYCRKKAILAWQWAKYLRAYKAEANRRCTVALEARSAGETYASIANRLGLRSGAAFRLLQDIERGRATTAGHAFPHFAEWIKERWVPELGLLRVFVSHRVLRDEREQVWNMLVSSPDHSYLLANGANNFNSFEVMSGRVYYAFDRKEHVGDYPYNPKYPLWVGQDFNIDPMSSVLIQPQPNGELWVVGEIVLNGSNTEEVCDELERRYWRTMKSIVIYPDPAGTYRQHARGESDLDIFRQKGFTRLKYRRKHPPQADRINAVNRMLKAADGSVHLRIDKSARVLIDSLEQTIYKPGSREIDKSMGIEHSSDALGYPIELEYPVRTVKVAGISI